MMPSWEWLVLLGYTIAGPLIFNRFLPVRTTMSVRGGATFEMNFGVAAQILRCVAKFAIVWLIALLLANAGMTGWLRVWVLAPAVLGLIVHTILARKHRVHWLRGSPLR